MELGKDIQIKQINPGTGLGDIQFGMSQDEIIQLLGTPTEQERLDTELEDAILILHYDEYNFSLSFFNEDGWHLDTISISSPYYEFSEVSLVGKTFEEVKDLLKSKGIQEIGIEDHSTDDSPNHILVIVDSLALNLWFENDSLTEVQWGVNEEEEPWC